MTFIPSQGFRHAATLLLTNTARAIGADTSPETARAAVHRLAEELSALADDMRAPAETAAWLIAEINTTIDRLPHSFDRNTAKADAAAVLARVASRACNIEPRDLFLIYVPEDRLPVAAPLAVELTKRGVSVALAEYEVAAPERLNAAVSHGLTYHRGGVVLRTSAFERAQWPPLRASDRVRVLGEGAGIANVNDIAAWARRLRLSKS